MSTRTRVLVTVIGAALSFLPAATFAASATLTTPLRLGDSGPQVKILQIALNQDLGTRVAEAGDGSPGHETEYFGLRTLDAVKRFQEKYRPEILVPSGLSTPTGFVGVKTLAKLTSLAATSAPKAVVTTTPSTFTRPAGVPAPVALTPSTRVPAGTNPNSLNLEYFVSVVKAVGARQGATSESLSVAEQGIRTGAATTTDLRALFFATSFRQAAAGGPADFFAWTNTVLTYFTPKTAYAVAASPFGGKLLYAFPCACSGNWILTMEPLPPTYAGLLTYMTGSQKFLSNNTPETTHLLGLYEPAGICLIPGSPCAYVPNEGLITPILGSSPL